MTSSTTPGHQYDVWLDIECTISGASTVVCVLFAKLELPVRPMPGEHLTFWSAKDSSVSVGVVTVLGVQSAHYVSTEVDDVAHHVHPGKIETSVSTFVRCRPLHVASIEDARRVATFLCEQHAFELDPYGVNMLEQKLGAG